MGREGGGVVVGHFPTPGLFPCFWHARGFLSEYSYTEDITGKKADCIICQGQVVLKACSRFYACISSLPIKPELRNSELSTWINVFLVSVENVKMLICLKTAVFDLAINEKCCSVDGGTGLCPLFSSPRLGMWQHKSPHPRAFAIEGKKKRHKGPGGGGGLVQLELTDALSFQFQTNKKEIEICEFEVHLKFVL